MLDKYKCNLPKQVPTNFKFGRPYHLEAAFANVPSHGHIVWLRAYPKATSDVPHNGVHDLDICTYIYLLHAASLPLSSDYSETCLVRRITVTTRCYV